MTDTSIDSPGAWPAEQPELDLFFFETVSTPEGRQDPYSRYKALRDAAPVYKSGIGPFICTGYQECQFALRDPRFGQKEERVEERMNARFGHLEIYPKIVEQMGERRALIDLNPPDHTRLRRLVSKAFTPRTVERLRPHIVELVDALLDEIPTGETVDVMEALAFKLPIAVISNMIGVPSADWPRFREVMGRLTVLLEPIIPDEEVGPAFEAQAELTEYFRSLVALRRERAEGDLLSELIGVQEGSDALTEDELISTVILLFGAGFETTTNLIGNGLLALLKNPDQLRWLRAARVDGEHEGTAMRSAVDELLRYDSPVQFDGRFTFDDVDLGGIAVPEGSEVITVLGAANRDPARFSAPDELDLQRDEGPPLSFASGIHYCLGAALARAEGEVVFDRLLGRFGAIELATENPVFRNRITLRGLSELPVVFGH